MYLIYIDRYLYIYIFLLCYTRFNKVLFLEIDLRQVSNVFLVRTEDTDRIIVVLVVKLKYKLTWRSRHLIWRGKVGLALRAYPHPSMPNQAGQPTKTAAPSDLYAH